MSGAGSSTSAEGGGTAPAQNWGGNLGAIVQFFQGKGLNNYAIAGILGNLKVESGLSTNAYNAGEGAIGIAQWEGGRRTALQAYAAAHGMHETDLNAQLGYMWHELTTGYSGVLSQLRSVGSAEQAATLWDAHYEVSAGTTRAARISNANAYFTGGFKSIGGETTAGTAGAGLGGGGGGGSAGGGGMSKDDFGGVDGLGHLLDTIPELKSLVDKAMAGNWTGAKFQNAVEDSKWWKTHSDTARSAIIQQANDPAAYGQSLNHVENTLQALANQTGMAQFLGVGWRNHLAQMAILTGNEGNQQWLIGQLFAGRSFDHVTDPNSLTGQMGQVAQQLQSMSADYGYKWTPRNVATFAARVVSGQTTIDTYKGMLTTWAKSAFPSLAAQLDAGATIKDLAAPYQQSMSQLLEIDPGKLDTFDPTIRKALQGTPDAKGQLASTPLWQFENQVRSDPRWASTDNAHASMSTMALQLGQSFGFNG